MSSPDAIWSAAEKTVVTGDVTTLERLRREHPAKASAMAASPTVDPLQLNTSLNAECGWTLKARRASAGST